MSPKLKAKDLLSQLSRMEHSLHDFSFEELTSKEAAYLKSIFETFKKTLENKIFQPSGVEALEDENELFENTSPPEDSFQKDRHSNQLIANVSKEIESPLNDIIGLTDFLLEDPDLNAQQSLRVNAIQKASYSLLEIMSECLEYSQLSVGLEQFENIPFNFRNLVGDVIFLCNTLIADKEVDLRVAVDTQAPEVLCGDPSKLSQVLLNLLGSAIKPVKSGSIQLMVQSEILEKDSVLLRFSITSSEVSISKEDQIFPINTFGQEENNGHQRFGAYGLDLNIVKQIIERLGGEISSANDLHVGTTLNFSIPFEVSTTSGLTNSDKDVLQASVKDKDAIKGMQILVFGENTMNQKRISKHLEKWECKGYVTENVQLGMNILAQHRINLVLIDLTMPNVNGIQIAQGIRSAEEATIRTTTIIALNKDFSTRNQGEGEKSTFDDFILEPFNSDELLLKLAKHRRATETGIRRAANTSSGALQLEQSEIDLSTILEECMGDFDMLDMLIALYRQNILEFIGNVKVHLENADMEQIAFAAHKIKSGLQMIGAKRLCIVIEQIQKCCQSDSDIEQLRYLYDGFLSEYPTTEIAIDEATKKLRGIDG